METTPTKPRSGGSSEAPTKVSPRAARQLRVNPVGFGSSSPASPSTNAPRTPKDTSPKLPDRKSPRSPVLTEKKKRPGRVAELETRISELQDGLKEVNKQLNACKTSKEESEQNAEGLKQELEAVSLKLEESQKQLVELHASKEADVAELKGISEEKDQAWETQLDIIRKQHSIDASSLASALDEIQTLNQQLQMQGSTDIQLQVLKVNLGETLSLLENMKIEIKGCKESEAQAQGLVHQTLAQLEEAKQTVHTLRNDGMKSMEAYNCVASELEDSRARITLLEGLVTKLKSVSESGSPGEGKCEIVLADDENDVDDELKNLRSEVASLKSSTLEAAEYALCNAQAQSGTQILEAELRQAKSAIDELRANLMDKETELQAISEENECLSLKLRKSIPDHQDENVGDEWKILGQEVANLKADLLEKETQLQNMKEENKTIKAELERAREVREEGIAGEAEQDTQVRAEVVMEEAEKSKRRAERASEQLEAAQAANAELEAELRRLKVQSDQWRKAAEAAASMLSSPVGNGRFVQRTGSLDSSNGYSPIAGRVNSPYLDDYDDDDDAFKKKNGNVLRKIGGFWKKPQK